MSENKNQEFYHEINANSLCDDNVDGKLGGRWTKDEQRKFVEALQIYGKNWKKIEQYLETRSGSQIRSHAQKYFKKLNEKMTKV